MNKIYLLLLLSTLNAFAHKDTTFVKLYDNVRVITTTGDNYEEVNKTYIIGQYLSLLCKEYHFKDTITLDFKHSYTHTKEKKFSIKRINKKFVISYRDDSFNIFNTLKIHDYILKNKTSKKLELLNINNLDEIYHQLPSKSLSYIISLRIYRPTEILKLFLHNGYSYYVENNKFFIYKDMSDNNFDVKQIVDDIYQITEVNSSSLIVFDSRETFYLITDKSVSDKVHFKNDEYYNIYKILSLSDDVLSIKLSKPYNQEKFFIFVKSKNKLVEI